MFILFIKNASWSYQSCWGETFFHNSSLLFKIILENSAFISVHYSIFSLSWYPIERRCDCQYMLVFSMFAFFSSSIQLSVSTSFCFKTLTAELPPLPHLCPRSKWSKIFLDSQGATVWSIAVSFFSKSNASYQQNPPSSLITPLALFLTDSFLPFPPLSNRAYSSFPRHSETPRPAMKRV